MDSLPNEVLGMILDELKPRNLFEEFGPGFSRNIKSMRLCCRKLTKVAARHMFQVIWLCLRSGSFTKVTSIMNYRLYSEMVHELQIFPLPRLSDYGEGRLGFIDGSLHSFYDEQAWCFFTPKEPKGTPQIEY